MKLKNKTRDEAPPVTVPRRNPPDTSKVTDVSPFSTVETAVFVSSSRAAPSVVESHTSTRREVPAAGTATGVAVAAVVMVWLIAPRALKPFAA
jgi:hypothetical protein